MTSPSSGGGDRRIARLLFEFAQLSVTDQNTFIEQLNDYLRATTTAQRETKKAAFANRMNLGPTGQPCPRCGK